MKHAIKSIILASSLCALTPHSLFANEYSGFFVGVNAGVAIADVELTAAVLDNDFSLGTGAGWLAGAEIGYRHFLGDNFGLKYYLSYSYMQTYGNSGRGGNAGLTYSMDTTLNEQLLAANVDFFYNFTESFGMYAGLGVGTMLMQPHFAISNNSLGNRNQTDKISAHFALPFNVGFLFNMGSAHAITLGAKIPLIHQDYISSRVQKTETIATYMVQLGYTYHFNTQKSSTSSPKNNTGYWGMEGYNHYRPKL